MITHLPVLLVLTPLIAVPFCLFLRNPRQLCMIASFAALTAFLIAILLLLKLTQLDPPISYQLGGWPPPWGIEYRVDHPSVLVMLLMSGVASMILLFAGHSAPGEIPNSQLKRFYGLMLLVLSGYLSVSITNDVFNLFVFFEIASLATYSLVATGHQRQALTASFQYFLMGSLGASFLLIGIGLLYQQTGTLNFTDLGQRVPVLQSSPATQMALAFVVTGLALKMALFPLHLWLPNAYRFSPSVVTVLLAAIPTKMSFYVLLRFMFDVFALDASTLFTLFRMLIIPLALAAILVGSVTAMFQTNLKKLLAYSSIAHIGYMVLPFSLASTVAVQASLVQFFNHTLLATTAFLAAGCIWYRLQTTDLDKMAGLGRQMPVSVAALIVAGLGMMGTPLTAGFVSKWYIFSTLLEEMWWLLPLLVLTTLMAVAYVWRIVEAIYFKKPDETAASCVEAPWQMLLPTVVMALACIYFGVNNQWLGDMTLQAAQLLLGESP